MPVSGRLYTVSVEAVSISAVQDLFLLLPGSTKFLALRRITLGQITGVTVLNLRTSLRTFTSVVTNGTGGTAPTPQRLNMADAAATFTARANDFTTRASTNGTNSLIDPNVLNTINGFEWRPTLVDKPPICPASGAFVIGLETAISSSVFNISCEVEELP